MLWLLIPRRIVYFLVVCLVGAIAVAQLPTMMSPANTSPQLLSDPFLQLPTADTVQVVWFTEFPGRSHEVVYGQEFDRQVEARTTQLSRTREDGKSHWDGGVPGEESRDSPSPYWRKIWRHAATVTGLEPGQRLPYRVISTTDDGQQVASKTFTLAAQPKPGSNLKILLTSDHQLKPMTAANLQQVTQTVGRVDAVLMAGDLVNIPDRASEWFDDSRGGAFFPCLQGRARMVLNKGGVEQRYTGGEIIQHALLFPAVGNHEVMGQFSIKRDLNSQLDDTLPRAIAAQLLAQKSPPIADTDRQTWLQDHSFNTVTFNEIFSLPTDRPAGKDYYAASFGDVRLIVLYATNVWRSAQQAPNVKGRYQERQKDLADPSDWGYGQHLFERIDRDSEQYQWLQSELQQPEFQQAKYKIVMLHHPPHSLGANVVPAYTDPVQQRDRAEDGSLQAVRYEYPIQYDYLIRDVMPLLEDAGVQLVFYGHSHLWNRFVSDRGMHYLESSNVGNSYGVFIGDKQRNVPEGFQEQYVATGDPNGLEPVIPNLKPLRDADDRPLPAIASNDITVFSILDTGTGSVTSYAFDLKTPTLPAIAFDRFSLNLRDRDSSIGLTQRSD